jgi:PKD repeat protein
MNYNYVILLLLLSTISCQNETTSDKVDNVIVVDTLKVDFSYTIEEGRAPVKVDFNNNHPNGNYYEWDFGDGQTSALLNPQHAYMTGGEYEVRLTGRKDNVEKSYTKKIIIKSALKSFTINKLIIHKIPARDGSENWDLLRSEPDVFFQIKNSKGNFLYELSKPQKELQQNQLPHEINFNSTIYDLDDNHSIQFWDYDDLDDNDFMGSVDFNPTKMNTDTTSFRLIQNNLEIGIQGVWNE